MPQTKVTPEHRQRIAVACDPCKKKKQKCDGLRPCGTCSKSKKDSACTYTQVAQPDVRLLAPAVNPNKRVRSNGNLFAEAAGSASGANEEAINKRTRARMLEDSGGRLVYIGDSATFSLLQLLRLIVEKVVGPTAFSSDPARHAIAETQMSVSPNIQLTHQLPSRETCLILVDSFFVNTCGLLHIFDEMKFLHILHQAYMDPLMINHAFLCHLNLVLAIGLCLATPVPGTREAAIINEVRSKYPNQSEVFYLNAKSVCNPTFGLEDGDTWSIQALLLMAAYMLYKSKRQSAYSLNGMAVRTAYSLGMHRAETLILYPVEEQDCRRRLWRSLFVMDRVLATYLGRPLVIAEEDCSGDLLYPRTNTLQQSIHLGPDQISSAGLEATLLSTHIIGLVLRKVYSQRRISTSEVQGLVDECKQHNLPPALHWRRATSTDTRQAMAILHSNLAYCHSIILLSRPFFLHVLSLEVQRTHLGDDQEAPESQAWMEKCSHACIIASTNTIALIQNAYEGRYLSKFDSSITYALFSAALIIFANEFARPGTNTLGSESMVNAISIMSFCGDMDPQAKRLARVLSDFRNTIQKREHYTSSQPQRPTSQLPPQGFPPYMNEQNNFMSTLEGGFNLGAQLTNAGSGSTHANTFDSPTSSPYALPTDNSFPGLLDLTNNILTSLAEPDPSDDDEVVDFDEMWVRWSVNRPTPRHGTPSGGPGHDANGTSMPMGAPPMGVSSVGASLY